MIDQEELKKIKDIVEELLQKMTVVVLSVDVKTLLVENKEFLSEKDSFQVEVTISEPQVLIGQQGQTLLEIQRLIRMVVNKKLKKDYYVSLDINDYKKKKIEYLKSLAVSLANEVAFTKTEKILFPMSSYERRVIHAELSQRKDVATESRGDGEQRCVVVKPI